MPDVPPDHCFASLSEIEELAKSDPYRVADLRGETIRVGGIEGIVDMTHVVTIAGRDPYTEFHVRWQDEPL
jgi:hypothetical protein